MKPSPRAFQATERGVTEEGASAVEQGKRPEMPKVDRAMPRVWNADTGSIAEVEPPGRAIVT